MACVPTLRASGSVLVRNYTCQSDQKHTRATPPAKTRPRAEPAMCEAPPVKGRVEPVGRGTALVPVG